jgi:hypothetical protein
MTMKDLVRPLPGVRQLSRLRQHLEFTGSAAFWEQKYRRGETSGPGSYGVLGARKAEFLNAFVRKNSIRSIIEFGCGDGQQLSLSDYPRYIGLDVSVSAIRLCASRFAPDHTKSFFRYDGACFFDRAGIFVADLSISLDVIYHLVEDDVFETYLTHLFAAGSRYVLIYSTNGEISDAAPHVRHRNFTARVAKICPEWRLIHVTPGPNVGPGRADFFVYERVTAGSL